MKPLSREKKMAKKLFRKNKDKDTKKDDQEPSNQDDGWPTEEEKRPLLDKYVEWVELSIGR